MSSKTLGQIGELRTGFHPRGPFEYDVKGSHSRITIGEVSHEGIDSRWSIIKVELGERARPHELKCGDVLLKSRGSGHHAAAVSELGAPTVAIAPLYVLRLHGKLAIPEYIAWWINRSETQSQLQSVARGTYAPSVLMKDFADLQVPLPDLRTQESIVAIDKLRKREIQISADLDDLREEYFEQAITRAVIAHASKIQHPGTRK